MYVSNIMTEHGETDGFNVSDCIKQLNKYVGSDFIDVVVASRIVPQIDGFDYMKLNAFYSSISEKPEYSAFKKSRGAIYKFIR